MRLASGEGFQAHARSAELRLGRRPRASRERRAGKGHPRRDPALSAYHVQSAQGLVKLDAMEIRIGCPTPAARDRRSWFGEREINRYPRSDGPGLVERLRKVMGIGSEYMSFSATDRTRLSTSCPEVARPGAVVLAPRPTRDV